MDLLQFFKKKSSYKNSNLISQNSSPSNSLYSISTGNKRESKEEFISKLEQFLNTKLQEQDNQFLVKLILCDKKHSSARYKHPFIEVRLSKHSSKKILQEHSELLISKLSKKLIKKQSQLNSISHKNSTHEFIKSIQRGYFYVANYKINLILNNTRTVVKIEENKNYENCLNTNSNSSELKNVTISIPKIDITSNLFLSKDNIHIFIKKLEEETILKLKKIEQQVAKCLCLYFEKQIADIIRKLNSKTLNSSLRNISLNYVQSKWGHCTSKNDIMIHVSLLNSQLKVFEYVIYHELAHTIEKNHSQKYWKVCNSLTPNTKYAREYLKNSPPVLFIEHPNLEIDF